MRTIGADGSASDAACPAEEDVMAVSGDAKTTRSRSRKAPAAMTTANGADTAKGKSATKLPVDLSNERLIDFYRQMVLIRRFEE